MLPTPRRLLQDLFFHRPQVTRVVSVRHFPEASQRPDGMIKLWRSSAALKAPDPLNDVPRPRTFVGSLRTFRPIRLSPPTSLSWRRTSVLSALTLGTATPLHSPAL